MEKERKEERHISVIKEAKMAYKPKQDITS